MHFDTIPKTLFQASCLRLLESLTTAPVREWINVEIPSARMNKLDLVAWLTDGRLYDERAAVRRILARIAKLPASQRLNAMSQLLVLSGLRRLEYVIKEESVRMPVTIDLMENRVIRDYFLQGKEEGRVEGEQEGRAEGKREGRAE